jgi:hypothetical protein
MKTQLEFVRGKILVKAGRHYKKGEEFTINYNVFATTQDMFKNYG